MNYINCMEEISYTLNEILALNNGQKKTFSFFDAFPEPKSNYQPYNNPFNNRLKGTGTQQKQYVQTARVYSDDRIIDDIKKIINNVSTSNVKQHILKLNRLDIPPNQEANIANIFHESMIKCNTLVDSYLNVFLGFKNKNIEFEVLKKLVVLIINEFRKPHIFKDDESVVETGVEKTKRWRLTNTKIIVNLALKINDPKNCFYPYRTRLGLNISLIKKHVIDRLFDNAVKYNTVDTYVIISIWPLIIGELEIDTGKYYDLLKQMSTDTKINKMLRTKILSIIPDDDDDSGEDSDLDILDRFN